MPQKPKERRSAVPLVGCHTLKIDQADGLKSRPGIVTIGPTGPTGPTAVCSPGGPAILSYSGPTGIRNREENYVD